jgi:hypothetical protein
MIRFQPAREPSACQTARRGIWIKGAREHVALVLEPATKQDGVDDCRARGIRTDNDRRRELKDRAAIDANDLHPSYAQLEVNEGENYEKPRV